MHSLKDIAFQAGVSLATVDRVIHERPGVKANTRRRVQAAIRELDRQAASNASDGRRIAVDIILEAPRRFSTAVRAAFEAELEGLRPASLRLRFHQAETFHADALNQLLRSIRRRGTHGLVVKLPQRPDVIAEVQKIAQSGIPIVTLVTDLPETDRLAYIGMDNGAAGRTAAFLINKIQSAGDVLAIMSSHEFEGEVARMEGLRAHLQGQRLHVVDGTMGRNAQTGTLVRNVLRPGVEIGAVYSAGGGNRAILSALRDFAQHPQLFVAHDLDEDNRALLASGEIDFVIHHDLRHDARSSCQHILKAQRLLPAEFVVSGSAIQLATPWNLGGE